MSHERETFPILENIENEKGEVVHRLNEGDRPVADDLTTKKNGLIGFSFKDKDGRVVLPQLNNEGAITVSFDAGTTIRGRGADVDGDKAAKMVLVDLTLTADRTYSKLSAQGSCFRDTEFEVVLIDDSAGSPVETLLEEFLTGPGQFTTKSGLEIDEFNTTGFSGVVKLQLRAINLNRESKTIGSMSVNEIIANTTPNP